MGLKLVECFDSVLKLPFGQ